MKEHRIEKITDLLAFDADQLDRMIPDLMMWHSFCRELAGPDVEVSAFIWKDDGRPGVLTAVNIVVKETGKEIRVSMEGRA